MSNFTKLEEFYADDGYCGFSGDYDVERFREYVEFVKEHAEGEIYELGSGRGEAAYALWKGGVKVTATDIFPENARSSFEKLGADIPVVSLNLNKIEKEDNSVHNYCLHQVLEHIETPERALSEIYRTLKSGGKFLVVGPNLISPFTSLKVIFMTTLGKWKAPWFKRTDGYSYPFGDSIFGSVGRFFLNTYLTFGKLLFSSMRKPRFRTPCLKKPANSDSDAVLYLNPMDLKAMLTRVGFDIESYQKKRRLKSFGGSTWIVARKP